MDKVLINKAGNIERCLLRINQEYNKQDRDIALNITSQDAITLNLQRACQAAISGAFRLVKIGKYGAPSNAYEAFDLLFQNNIIDSSLLKSMISMIGFRNLSIHEYEKINLDILTAILNNHLKYLKAFAVLLIGTK